MGSFQFPAVHVSEDLVYDLHAMNPWWTGEPQRGLPPLRRTLVGAIHRRLRLGLAPIVVIRGPRQVGKSTAALHVVQDILETVAEPRQVFRVQWDETPALSSLGPEPILRLVHWYEQEILRTTINAMAGAGKPVYLIFDEVQTVKDWHVQLKHLVDLTSVRMVVTGSSALQIEAGRDSLAGRLTTLEAAPLSLTEIARFGGGDLGEPFLQDNGLEPLVDREFWHGLKRHGQDQAAARDTAFRLFSERGGYPVGHRSPLPPWPLLADHLNETVIRRVVLHDLRSGSRGRPLDPQLLEEIFRLAFRYAGQSPNPQVFAREVRRTLGPEPDVHTVNRYLQSVGDTLLVRLVRPLELRLKRAAGFPKLCLADHALRASWLAEVAPLDPDGLAANPHLTPLAGHLAESVVGSTFSSIHGLDVAYLPGRFDQPELDFVLTVGTRRIPVEVKYQRTIDPLGDTEGLRTFLEKAVNNAPFGILVTQTDRAYEDDPRIVSVPLSSLMLLR
jgi:predicted AAA+ superfamily ATPase